MKRCRNATSVELATCDNPQCAAIHIWLLDANGNNFAQGMINASDIDVVCADLQAAKLVLQPAAEALAACPRPEKRP